MKKLIKKNENVFNTAKAFVFDTCVNCTRCGCTNNSTYASIRNSNTYVVHSEA